jgi:hypothetical protein
VRNATPVISEMMSITAALVAAASNAITPKTGEHCALAQKGPDNDEIIPISFSLAAGSFGYLRANDEWHRSRSSENYKV